VIVEFIVNLASNIAANLAVTGADAARTTGLIIGAAVFLLAGVTLLVAIRFRAIRNRDKVAEAPVAPESTVVADAKPEADEADEADEAK
jgi:hypothetical protein